MATTATLSSPSQRYSFLIQDSDLGVRLLTYKARQTESKLSPRAQGIMATKRAKNRYANFACVLIFVQVSVSSSIFQLKRTISNTEITPQAYFLCDLVVLKVELNTSLQICWLDHTMYVPPLLKSLGIWTE